MGISKEKVKVSSETIDDYCKEKLIKKIDFLKIDAEGSEYLVLDGAKEMIKNKNINMIQFEYGKSFFDTKIFLKDVIDFLKDYNIFRIIPEGLLFLGEWQSDMENYSHQNIFCILKSMDHPINNALGEILSRAGDK